jgi:hypothetical protein
MHTLCSSTSPIPPISENRRRLMQYTPHDTCNNQTLPHPTTPLGTLAHQTPSQHTLAGNAWTTSDLRVMSIVLGLLDKPSYVRKHFQQQTTNSPPPPPRQSPRCSRNIRRNVSHTVKWVNLRAYNWTNLTNSRVSSPKSWYGLLDSCGLPTKPEIFPKADVH